MDRLFGEPEDEMSSKVDLEVMERQQQGAVLSGRYPVQRIEVSAVGVDEFADRH